MIVMFCISLVLIFVSLCSGDANNSIAKANKAENILCRECGSQVLTSDAIISKSTSASRYSFNDTLFNRKEVLVQLLVQDIFLQYSVITSSESSCVGKGDWEDDELWFPGHVMKPCFCPECGAFLGWMFENDSPMIVHSTQFYALVLTNLISENCKYFLNYLDYGCLVGLCFNICLMCWFLSIGVCLSLFTLISLAYDKCYKSFIIIIIIK